MSPASPASLQCFNQWFAQWWAGDDPQCPNSVPSTGDWSLYSRYESLRDTAWAAWQAGAAAARAASNLHGASAMS